MPALDFTQKYAHMLVRVIPSVCQYILCSVCNLNANGTKPWSLTFCTADSHADYFCFFYFFQVWNL